MTILTPFQLVTNYRERVWGGQHLKRAQPPIGEAWIIYEQNRVRDGAHAGRTLAELVEEAGDALLGKRALARTGRRFPLLIKLLDCADWLSVQVHPNDEQAVQLEGPGHFGKTEAWHILEAEAGARLIAGVRPGTTGRQIAEAVRQGDLLELVQYHTVRRGDTFFMAAGTLHALGPGILLYEVQQTSDITYRVFDWNRPLAAGRQLHIDKSIAVINPELAGEPLPLPPASESAPAVLVSCPYFTLTSTTLASADTSADTLGETFHALTVESGLLRVSGDGWQHDLAKFDSLIVPAGTGRYYVQPLEPARLLVVSVE